MDKLFTSQIEISDFCNRNTAIMPVDYKKRYIKLCRLSSLLVSEILRFREEDQEYDDKFEKLCDELKEARKVASLWEFTDREDNDESASESDEEVEEKSDEEVEEKSDEESDKEESESSEVDEESSESASEDEESGTDE